jgi:hypothetical protein
MLPVMLDQNMQRGITLLIAKYSGSILFGLAGDWQTGSDLLWPDIPCPPKQYLATFRKCIRATFCTLAPKYQPAHFSIRLDRTLGSWHAVPRNTWYPCYKSTSQLFLRRHDTPVKWYSTLVLTIWFVSACEYAGNGSRYKV